LLHLKQMITQLQFPELGFVTGSEFPIIKNAAVAAFFIQWVIYTLDR